MRLLVLNPGSNSLKFEVIDTAPGQAFASGGAKRISAAIESFGKPDKQATLSVMDGRRTAHQEDVKVADFTEATKLAVEWMRGQSQSGIDGLDGIGVRVVHGGPYFHSAVRWSGEVRERVESLEDLAPLHNKSSLEIMDAVAPLLPRVPVAITLDTAFHQTLPEVAWRYPIDRALADRHGLRKFGFHGVSHRYLMERFAELSGKAPREVTLVSLHLESGSSACAIRRGKSVDTSMGLTPLEGLMMGSRSGSVDPAIVEVLMRKEDVDVHGALDILNKHSGLLGIGGDLDTRVLAKRGDETARLALAMFSYRVRAYVASYLALLASRPVERREPSIDTQVTSKEEPGPAQAILFGAGIGEDSPAIRAAICDGLQAFGIFLDPAKNQAATTGEALISTAGSHAAVWALPSEEGLQIAHECTTVFAQMSL